MNSTEPIPRRSTGIARLIFAALFAVSLVFASSHATAQQTYYINNGILSYPGNQSSPPYVDALNFINNDSFTVNFTVFSLTQPFFETWNTINYTNNGLLMANSGFQFDTQSSYTYLHTRAGTFYNLRTVSCGSTNDVTDPYDGELADEGWAQCLVNATNIVITNNGTVDVGIYGLINLSGQNVDLYRSKLNIEGAGVNEGGTGYFGTNAFFPGGELHTTTAQSPFFPFPPYELDLTNSIAFTNEIEINPTNNIDCGVFIQDTSGANVTPSVYFGPGGDYAVIQWAASYLDSATGNTYSNYLYLVDYFALGASTNVLPITGVPINFGLESSSTPLLPGGVFTPPSGLVDTYPFVVVTNMFDVANINVSYGYSTNNIGNQTITNLPGRVQISGDNNVDMRLMQITGPNYISVTSTNQFVGSDGALIQTPYADLHLGRTNGFLTVSNVMQGNIPAWSGNIVAWNTRGVVVDPVSGATNDERVLIVSSQLTPTVAAQVQDLILHGTNSIVISDTFNVMRTFNADAQNLTLTTNPPGNGATSLDGELNLEPTSIFWQSSVPNLRYLTNNGAIRMQNLAYFGFPFVTNYYPLAAIGTLSESGTNAVKKDRVTLGTNQYMFVGTLTNSIANQVAIVPGSFDSTMNNLIAAINGGPGAGASYSTATQPNPVAMAGSLASHAFTVTALTPGTIGNSVATTFAAATSSVNLTWNGHSTLYGGVQVFTNVVPYLFSTAFINNGIFSDQGSIIYAGNFTGSGIISNNTGSFTLSSLTTTLTNLVFQADGDVSITASNLVTGHLSLQAGSSLTLIVTNELTDTGSTNGSTWLVGYDSIGTGINLPRKPAIGDLLNTAITLQAPDDTLVANEWAGIDHGLSATGYTNNVAVGTLILDVAEPQVIGQNGGLSFTGTGVSNALYVDLLVLTNFATQGNATNNYNFPWLTISSNMIIYYAQALEDGVSVAEAIDQQSQLGANNHRLRWIYSYAGLNSSTNIVYTNSDGSTITNTVNTALAQSSDIDSDSDGRPNGSDPTPFFITQELKINATATNVPPKSVRVQWTTIPNATNYIYYTTNLLGTWLPFTNFTKWYFGNNVVKTNKVSTNGFASPQIYLNDASLPDNAQQTNVWVVDTVTNVPHYYKAVVWPWINFMPQ